MIEVNSLWIGVELSTLEQLAIVSHLQAGHVYNLWVYGDVKSVPEGTRLRNGNEILPSNDIFSYNTGPGKGSFSAFSNLFRYKFLFERGGWWVDTDVVCLKAFDFSTDHVFATERNRKGQEQPTTCVIRFPVHSPCTKYCFEMSARYDRQTLGWGTIGPQMLTRAIFEYGLEHFAVRPDVFCPVDWPLAEEDPTVPVVPDLTHSHAVHLWHEFWRRKNLDKDGRYPPDCLFETLKRAILRTN